MQTSSDLNPEIDKPVQTAFLFDVDGVITDPREKKITESSLLDMIADKLEKGSVVTFNTGRSTEWAIQNVFPHMIERAADENHFENFFIVGEKGGTWAKYMDGKWQHFRDETLSIPEDVKNEAEGMAQEEPYASIGRELDPKQSMYSWEMVDGMEIEEYQKKRQPLVEAYQKLIKDKGLEDEFKVDATTIAIDIENKHVGKHLGARRILNWLKSRNINPVHFIAIGDSESDLEMADELDTQGKSVEFWYVNPAKPLNMTKPYPIKVSREEFSAGTVEMLKKLNSK